jgi:glycosyltransferase involved in cell wall biosynthesis
MEHFPFGETAEDFLLVVGRVSEEKGTHIAVQVALALDMRLIIAAKVDSVDRPYFTQHVEPYLSEKIQLIGEVNEDERNELMRRALCFLHPVTWKEPFGLVMIEAMACGCPVVAFDLGSIPEVVRSGSTGFVVRTLDEMIDAVRNIKKISRSDCREYVLSRFGVAQMTDGYEKIYAQVVEAHEVPYTTNSYEFLGTRSQQHKRT